MKAIGINDFLNKKFDTYPFKGKWLDTFGEPEKNFVMHITGESGNGKTELATQLAKLMAGFTKVLFCSYEQGISKSLQDALNRNNMHEVSGGVLFLGNEPFVELVLRLKKRASPTCVVIDSLDYMKLTTDQYKFLKKTFPRKSFIIISWSANGKPKSQYAKDIEYMSDIKGYVKNFKLYVQSRFGGNVPFVIWDRKPKQGEQLRLIDGNN
ncbi:MAG: ATP-dependent serine protease [Bacteroidetes bacterium]|nr:ATP-dependent serine protease [Bacteroidota bacterium]